MATILQLNPATYQRHSIHGENRIWSETNCYCDVLIELIHAYGFDPIAALPFTLRIDFEGDQWTFFKYPLIDLLDLYGFDVEELNPWDNLAAHVELQVRMGRPVLVELDSFFLPDTAGSAYKLAHVKSTVAVNEIDLQKKKMGYFHGQGYYELSGEDFDNVFQINGLAHERMLPPYIELVKTRMRPEEISSADLLTRSKMTLKRHLTLMPEENPFERFTVAFERALPELLNGDIDLFHKYSFATFRQFGACFELAATYCEWLGKHDEKNFDEVVQSWLFIAESVKTIQFQFARAIARKKNLDLSLLVKMAEHWLNAKEQLKGLYLE